MVLWISPDGSSIIVDAGNYSNVAVGNEFEIFRETEAKDEEGAVIWRESKKIGEARVVEVQEDRAKCVLTRPATEQPQKGDVVRLKKPQQDEVKDKKRK